jgi:starvation-inducible outer membrane lipoprotein
MSRAVVIVLVLAGCTTVPPRVEGNDRTAIVYWGTSVANSSESALPAAEAHCAKHGRKARYAGPAGDFRTAFDCVL